MLVVLLLGAGTGCGRLDSSRRSYMFILPNESFVEGECYCVVLNKALAVRTMDTTAEVPPADRSGWCMIIYDSAGEYCTAPAVRCVR